MNQLFLEDLKNNTEEEIRNHLVSGYKVLKSEMNKYKILIAYESVGSWGCDSSSFFLLRNKKNKKLYEVHGSHCSCHGFEDQFEPETTTLKYLKSDKFYFCAGGYDPNDNENKQGVKNFINKLKQ